MSNYLGTVQNILYDSIKTTVGVMEVNMTVSKPIHNALKSENIVIAYGVDGVCYALAGELVNVVTGAPSNLMNMQYTRFLDDSLFMGEVAFATEVSGVADLTLNAISSLNLPIPNTVQYDLTQGLIISTGRELSNIIANPNGTLGNNQVVSWLRYPITNILGKAINA